VGGVFLGNWPRGGAARKVKVLPCRIKRGSQVLEEAPSKTASTSTQSLIKNSEKTEKGMQCTLTRDGLSEQETVDAILDSQQEKDKPASIPAANTSSSRALGRLKREAENQ